MRTSPSSCWSQAAWWLESELQMSVLRGCSALLSSLGPRVQFFASVSPVSLLWQWLQLIGVIQPLAGLGERGYLGQQCLFLGQTCLLKVAFNLVRCQQLVSSSLFPHPHGSWDFEGELALSALILEFSLLLTHILVCSHDNKLVLYRHTQNSPKDPPHCSTPWSYCLSIQAVFLLQLLSKF